MKYKIAVELEYEIEEEAYLPAQMAKNAIDNAVYTAIASQLKEVPYYNTESEGEEKYVELAECAVYKESRKKDKELLQE